MIRQYFHFRQACQSTFEIYFIEFIDLQYLRFLLGRAFNDFEVLLMSASVVNFPFYKGL